MLHEYSTLALDTRPAWQRDAVRTFVSRVEDPRFPCTFAKGSITRRLLYFAFVSLDGDRAAAWEAATEALAAFAAMERTPDPYRVLVLCTDRVTATWEEDDELLWELCRWVVRHDPEPGPPLDLDQPGVCIPFMGMPWFFNLNSPVHRARASRNTTDRLAFIVQRSDSFAGIAPEHQHDAVREGIRARIGPYDGQPASPSLHGYAHNPEGVEWRQFHLPLTNDIRPAAGCPFHAVPRG